MSSLRINIYIEKEQYLRLRTESPIFSSTVREILSFCKVNAETFNNFFLQMNSSKLPLKTGMRVNVSLYEGDLMTIDTICRVHNLSRSAAVRWIIRFWFFRANRPGGLDTEKIGKVLEALKGDLAILSDRVNEIREQVESTQRILSRMTIT